MPLQEQLQQFVIDNFSPGLVRSLVDTKMPPGSADIAQNLRYDNEGGLRKRDNRAKYNGTSLGTNPLYHLERIYIGSNKYLLTVYTTTLKVGNDAAGTFANLKTGLTTDLRYTSVTYKNFNYLFNGTDSNIKTDGTSGNTAIQGCTAMSAAPTAALAADGNLDTSATYKYKFTWEYDSYQEATAGGGLTQATDGSNQKIELYDFESTPTNATHMRIYRTTGDGSLYYYHSRHTKTQVEAYLTGARYTDDTADGDLDSTIEAPTDNGTPVVCPYGILHKDRIFIAGNSSNKSRIYYSKIASGSSYPDIYPASNYIDIAPDDGDSIVGLAIDPTGTLCILKRNTIRKVYTDGDPTNWSVSEPFAFVGCIASYSIAQSPYGIIYLARKGESGREIRMFDGQHSVSLSDKVHLQVNEINRGNIGNVVGHYHQDMYLMAYTDQTTGNTYNDKVLLLDIPRKAYSVDVKNINCFASFHGSGDRGELYSGDSVNGIVYREDSTSYDIIHDTKSELDTGTFTDCVSAGTEADPTVGISGTITDQWGATKWEDMTTTNWEDLTGADDTWFPGGYFISDHLLVNASNFNQILWNETLGSDGEVAFYFRAGDTTAACDAASWNGPYSTPTGSDISAIAGKVYCQYRCHVLTKDTSVTVTPTINLASGYVIKVSTNSGTAAETAIEFNWRSGQLDLGSPRQRKRLRGIRLEYSSDSTGTLYMYYSKDRGSESSFAIDLSTDTDKYTANFAYNDFAELIRPRFYMNDTNNLTIKRLIILYTVKPPLWA